MEHNIPAVYFDQLATFGKKQGWTQEQIEAVDKQFYRYSQISFNHSTKTQINREFADVHFCIFGEVQKKTPKSETQAVNPMASFIARMEARKNK